MNNGVVFLRRKENNKANRILLFVFFTVLSLIYILACGINFYNESNYAFFKQERGNCFTSYQQVVAQSLPNLKDIIRDYLGGKKKEQVKENRKIMVYPGGYPLGFTMDCSGVVIVAIGSVTTADGIMKPIEGKNVKVGDVLYSINGETITSATRLHELLNSSQKSEESVDIVILRNNKEIKEKVTPAKELSTGMYRLGLWIRDNAAGVGTLTYVREDNSRFGALGHPVCEVDTGCIMPIANGNIYKCNIVGYNKGLRGNPGELRGLFLRNGIKAGVLDNNNEFGVYGQMGKDYINALTRGPIEVGFRNSVKTGKAKILTTIDGAIPEEYDIEIIKLSYQSKSDKKSMVIKITDKRLIEQTGGIIQGMSGSPIIQNGKLIGAVTHVFVSDPTKGFGVYIDWMIDN